MENEYVLTTFDNPFSPFDEYDQWLQFDEVEKGYYTNSYQARIVQMFEDSLELSTEEATELAIDEIVKYNVRGIDMKINKKEAEELIKKRESGAYKHS